jgi:hypothetical protein
MKVQGKLACGVMVLAAVVGAHVAGAQVVAGDQAPMFRGVDENLRLVDMADFVDGTPLLFLYTSAT